MIAWARRYVNRLRITESDIEQARRWECLIYAGQRFPDVKSAAELIALAQRVYEWRTGGVYHQVDYERAVIVPDGINVKPGGWNRA